MEHEFRWTPAVTTGGRRPGKIETATFAAAFDFCKAAAVASVWSVRHGSVSGRSRDREGVARVRRATEGDENGKPPWGRLQSADRLQPVSGAFCGAEACPTTHTATLARAVRQRSRFIARSRS
jgi:hypothetical protein